jgi:transcriptional regulator with XRE-family HTH domain
MFPNDSNKELATVLSYLAGRTLSKEEICTAMELPRSTYYDQLEKGTLITSDNLRRAAANLGINRAELLTRYRLIDPEEITSLAEAIGDVSDLTHQGPKPRLVDATNSGDAKNSSKTAANVSEITAAT